MSTLQFNHPFNTKEIEEIIRTKKVSDGSQLYLIDIREPFERKDSGTIPSSIYITSKDIPKAFHLSSKSFKKMYGVDKPDKTKSKILIFSKTSRRTNTIVEYLLNNGYQHVTFYDGGFDEWQKHSHPIQHNIDNDL